MAEAEGDPTEAGDGPTEADEGTTEAMLDDMRSQLDRTAVALVVKVMLAMPSSRGLGQRIPAPPVTIEQLNLEDDETPVSRLATNLLPLLQERSDNLISTLDPAHLLENTASKLQASLDGFQAIEQSYFQIARTIPLCWVEDETEEPQAEGLDSRQLRLTKFQFELFIYLINLLMELQQFWKTVRFSKDSMPVAEMAKDLVIEMQQALSDHIKNFIVFLQNSLFDSVIDDVHNFALTIGFSIVTRGVSNWSSDAVIQHQVENVKKPIIPVLKLSRAFMNKISRKTNHDKIVFRHLNATELQLVHKAAIWIPYWVDGLGQRIHEIPVQHGQVVKHLAAIIASFDKSLEVLKPYLKSLPPDVDPALVEAACKWLTVWYDQLLIALHHVSDLIGCDFPTPDHCATVVLFPSRE